MKQPAKSLLVLKKTKKNYSCFLKNENDETLLLVASENEHNVKAVPILEKK